MPRVHWNDIERCTTLKEAMNKILFWSSDTKVHTEKIEQKLKQIGKGKSMTHDRTILSQQIRLVSQLLETDHKYYASVPALLGHTAKYHTPDLYTIIQDDLPTYSQTWNDPERTFNYVKVFLEILKKYYKLTNNKISAHMITNDPTIPQNAHRFSYHGRQQYSADTNTLEVNESHPNFTNKGYDIYFSDDKVNVM